MAEPRPAHSMSRPEEATPAPRGTVIAAGLGFGVAADLLLRASGGPGLNLFLLFIGLALAIALVARRAGMRPSGEALAWMATGILFATAFVLRAAPTLQFLAFLAAAAAFALPALRAGGAWIRGSGVSDQIEAIGGAMAYAGLGALRLVFERRPGGGGGGDAAGQRPLWAVLRGLLLAVPLLLAFGALFASADAVFRDLVTNAIGVVDPAEIASHLFVAGLLGWLACGYLLGFLSGTRVRGWLPPGVPRPTLGILEVGTILASINLLFAAFVLVQIRYLFGGSGLVEVTPGLTYAEYAREGFAQLVLATALVLPCLLVSDWLLESRTARAARVFRLLGGLQLLLLIVVIASAMQRLRLYQDAYGLTESRFYGGVFLGWVTLVAFWFAATVLRGRRHRFAFLTLLSGYVVIAVLLVANPDVRIARANLDREGSFDAAYLGSLSADAVPTLIRALPSLPLEERCTLVEKLQRRWEPGPPSDWRNWNRSEVRAGRMVRTEGPGWHRECGHGPGPSVP